MNIKSIVLIFFIVLLMFFMLVFFDLSGINFNGSFEGQKITDKLLIKTI